MRMYMGWNWPSGVFSNISEAGSWARPYRPRRSAQTEDPVRQGTVAHCSAPLSIQSASGTS